jgi:ABC-type multidrug transport system ATPase subunit
MSPASIEVRELRKWYGETHAVDGVSFEVQPGSCGSRMPGR